MIKIIYKPEEKRAIAEEEGKIIGESTYAESDNIWIIDHTLVEKEYGGQGIAGRLVEELVMQGREKKVKILPLCPFAKREFEHKKEYCDVALK